MCIQHTRRTRPAPEHAALVVIGAVDAPRVWSFSELAQLAQTTRRVTLVCEAAPLDPRRWHTHDWTGVALTALLDAVSVRSGAQSVEVAGYDGRLTHLALADLDGALLALAADGQPLSAEQGFPARLILPGQSACAMPGFVQRISLLTEPAAPLAACAPRAVITRADRVADGRGVRLAGLAFGALERVAARLDDGPPVTALVSKPERGVAAAWSLDWRGDVPDPAQFTVEPVVDGVISSPQAGKPLARRWKPARHALNVSES